MCLKQYIVVCLCGCSVHCGSDWFPLCTSPGLRREDLYDEEWYPEVKEAIRRLPEDEKNMRMYRLVRAIDLSGKHAVLPRDQWTKPEEVSVGHSNPKLIIIVFILVRMSCTCVLTCWRS